MSLDSGAGISLKNPGFLDQITLGRVPNARVEYIPFFGRGASSDNVFKTVWPAGDFGKTIPTSTTIIDITSTDNSDTTQEIFIQGTLIDGTETTESVILNGTTPVQTINSYSDIFQMINRSADSLIGDVYASPQGSTKTGGVPDSQSDIRAFMDSERNRTSTGYYRVPSNKAAVLKTINASTGDGADVQIRLTANFEGLVPITLYEPLLRNGTVTTPIQLGFVLQPGVLFQIQAKGGTQKPDISGFCEIYLVDV